MKQSTKAELQGVVTRLQFLVEQVREDTLDANSGDHIAIIKNYDDVRTTVELIKEAQKALADMSERLSREAVPDALRAAGIRTITVEGVGRVSISTRLSASIIPEKREFAFDWLRQSGNGSLIVETVNAQTLSSFAKNLAETEGRELPADLFKTGSMSYTSITKVK